MPSPGARFDWVRSLRLTQAAFDFARTREACGLDQGASPTELSAGSRLCRCWRAFGELSWRRRGLLIRAWLLLLIAAPALGAFGFRWTQAVLGPAAGASPGRHDLASAQAIARIVVGAGIMNPFRPNCLARALVLLRLLRRQGLDARLRIGVATPDGAFAAHAWIEHGGVALTEATASVRSYAAFDEGLLTG